jgi:phosphoserine phosphatase RsbU/P
VGLDMFAELIGTMAVVVVVAYVLTRSPMYAAIMERRITWRHGAAIVVFFGLFSIYGTIGGVHALGAIANIRDLGPALAGLIAGPFIGLLTGVVGATHRYLQGGFTAASCSLSTLLAGVIAGLYHVVKKGDFPSIKAAIVLMAGIELLHMGLTLLLSWPLEQALLLVRQIILPMVAANALGIGLFAFMIQNLKREKAVESAKHVIEGELKAAREIQMRILPKIFPAFPERDEFDLYAVIEPAREVGGDFYDFFFVDGDKLCMVIGDASGKGVPASLFMAVTKTLVKARIVNGMSPDRAMEAVNDELSVDNASAMFSSVFCAVLDVRNGEVVYTNGGHNPPYVVRSSGEIAQVATEPGPLVGALEGATYRCHGLQLRPGDGILFYTDGVTEAVDESGTFFSTERLEPGLAATSGRPVREALGGIMERVSAFCGGAEQSDDITMMMIRYRGSADPQSRERMEISYV